MSDEAGASRGTAFELVGGRARRDSELLGIWRVAPSAARLPSSRDFGTGEAAAEALVGRRLDFPAGAEEEPVRWRVDFPADLARAAADLTAEESNLAAARHSLPEAGDRLSAFLVYGAAHAAVSGRSYGTLEDRSAEDNLYRLLNTPLRPAGGVAFGGAEEEGGWQGILRQFQDFLDQAAQSAGYYAWVETRVEGVLLAHTVVGWTGQMSSAWQEAPLTGHVAMHHRALDLAIESRNTTLWTMVATLAGAARLVASLATPLAPLLAPAAAWKFVQDVVAERRRHEQRQQDIKEETRNG